MKLQISRGLEFKPHTTVTPMSRRDGFFRISWVKYVYTAFHDTVTSIGMLDRLCNSYLCY